MLYHDFLRFELLKIINSPIFSKRMLKSLDNSLFNIEIPNNKKFGDVSTNIAMVFFKKVGLSPPVLAKKISEKLKKNRLIDKIDVIEPGFINIFFKDKFWHEQLNILLKEIKNYKYVIRKKKICIEFVSANPTGPMHIGHARGAVLGDTVASILEEVGHKVTREYYINDAGEQIKKLIKTIIFHQKNKSKEIEDDLYPGDYLKEVSLKVKTTRNSRLENGNKNLEKIVVDFIMRDIKKDLVDVRVKHHSFISEKSISTKENIDNLKKKLDDERLIYFGYQEKPRSIKDKNWEKQEQLLFRSRSLGDESDRALLKPNGELTYFMSDIIYHQNKIDRNFDVMINIWGADHSGYVKRLENAIGAVNRSKKYNFEIKLTALVNLLENKKIIKMSKRQGNYITMREVAGKVGIDVLRFMMISRNADKKIDFDFEIVKQKSKDNPVFYIQYAHARCMSIIKTFNKTFDLSLDKDKDFFDFDLSNLRLDEEKILIRNLCNFFNVIISSATYYEPHRVSNYLFELSKDFHAYWGLGKNNLSKKIIIESNLDLSKSRLVLVFAISKVIKKGLDLLKIECPESM